MSKKTNPIKYLISGGFGGVCMVLVGHPLDTIKVRLQTMPLPKPGEPPMYTSTLDCFRKTVQYEGFRGLYKGMSAPLVSMAPIIAINFFGFGLGKRLILGSGEERPLTKPEVSVAGAFGGMFSTSVMAPGERIKCLLQIQQGGKESPKYAGMFDCMKQLYKEGGIRSIYRGTFATLLRDVPGSGLYFLSYEWAKELLVLPDSSEQIKILGTLVAGGIAGMSYWLAAMPADVLKSRFQTAPEGTYKGLGDVFKHLMEKEGPTALYKGAAPVMIRAFPANAACFVGFELAMKFLNWIVPEY